MLQARHTTWPLLRHTTYPAYYAYHAYLSILLMMPTLAYQARLPTLAMTWGKATYLDISEKKNIALAIKEVGDLWDLC